MTELLSQVIEVSFSMSFLILILFLFSKVMHRRYQASVTVLAWLAIALRLILPWNISLPVPAITIPVPQAVVQPHTFISPIVENSEQPSESEAPAPLSNPRPVYEQPSSNREPVVDSSGLTISLIQILAGIWFAGIFIFVFHLISDYHRVKKLLFVHGQVILPQSPQGRLLKSLCRKLSIRKVPVLITSRSAPTPMAIGLIKPSIVIAPELINHENLDLILTHELIHLKQKDLWKKVILSMAQAIHWFNPFVWLMNYQAENDMEMACDQRLLKGQPKEVRAVYGRMLVDVIRQTRLPMTTFSTRFSSGKPLKKRIQALFDSSRKKKGSVILVLILLSTGMGSMLVACQTQAQTPESEEQLLQISRNEEAAEMMFESEDPSILDIMHRLVSLQRFEDNRELDYFDLKIHFNGQDYLAWTNPRWIYLQNQEAEIGYVDDPYVLYEFYALIGYEQPLIQRGETSFNLMQDSPVKITITDIHSSMQPENEVNWGWIQPNQYDYFNVFSDLHGEYAEVGRSTWCHQNPELDQNRLITITVHPDNGESGYPFVEPSKVSFIQGDLAFLNGWLVQLNKDYTEQIQDLLIHLSQTGSHFDSLEEEAELKKDHLRKNFPYVKVVEPRITDGISVYDIPQMNLRISLDQEVPPDVFMIFDRISKNSVGFCYYEWPIDDWLSYDYSHGSYDGYYQFSIFNEPPVDGGYFKDGALLATEIQRFSENEILCLTGDLSLDISLDQLEYMRSVGFWPAEDDLSMPLLEHLTFEKIH